MSKNNQYKLKEVKEMNIKYNGLKDVEIISPTYSKIQKSTNNRNSMPPSKTPKQLVKQISKISIKLKEKDNDEEGGTGKMRMVLETQEDLNILNIVKNDSRFLLNIEKLGS